jgi:integrase/recombinase XerD
LPLSLRSQRLLLEAVPGCFRQLARANVLLLNPASELELPRMPHRLPAVVPSAREMGLVFVQPNVSEPLGIRDRAILETSCSTGMPRAELAQLKREGLDLERGTVFIREGKGRRDRVVPIGDRALSWVRRYLDDIRPQWAIEPDGGSLFLTHKGEPIDSGYLTHLVRWCVEQAALGSAGRATCSGTAWPL